MAQEVRKAREKTDGLAHAKAAAPSWTISLGPDEEHVALLANPGKFDLLRRKGDLLDEGVAAVFGLAGGKAELLGLCFHAGKFTPAEAAKWLAGRGFTPLIIVPNSGRDRLRCPTGRS